MKLVQYHSPQGVVLALFVTEGPKYIKLLTMASTPRITKVHRGSRSIRQGWAESVCGCGLPVALVKQEGFERV